MRSPILYEINTRCWLHELSTERGEKVTLGAVPDEFFVEWRRLGFTHVWLMGVWTCGKFTRDHALKSPELRKEFDAALPDWKESDVAGSPYSISSHQVPRALGGEAGLKIFREKLHQHGLKLILDFVPNHLAVDHPWVATHPERFVQGDSADAGSFIGGSRESLVRLCHGRDPFFDPWMDTVQLDYRRDDTRTAMTAELESIARRCDGVRCDMAMLLITEIFTDTWKKHPCCEPEIHEEFWPTAIRTIQKKHAGFLFLAEAYWNCGPELIEQGFDYAYHKPFTDAATQHPEQIQSVVLSSEGWINQSAHFLENHDEARAATVLEPAVHKAAALAILTLPGMRFLHEGQLRGCRVKTPVQLGVRRGEPTDPRIERMYETLLVTLARASVGDGCGTVLTPEPAWDGNDTARWILLIQWHSNPEQFHLVAINFAPHNSQCYVSLNVKNLAQHTWRMNDLLSTERHERDGKTLREQGLYLDLPAFAAQCFEFTPVE